MNKPETSSGSISYIDYYIPEAKLAVEDFVDTCDVTEVPSEFASRTEYLNFIKSVLRLESIRVEKALSEYEMLEILLKRLFEKNIKLPSEIDLVLVVNEEASGFLAPLLNANGITTANIIKVNGNECANIEHSIIIANSLLNEGIYNNIIIVAWNKSTSASQRIHSTYALSGDGAALLLYSKSGKGLKLNKSWTSYNILSGNNAFIPEQHNKYLHALITNIHQFLSINNLSVKCVVVHNANVLLLCRSLHKNGFEMGYIYKENFSKYGHLNACDALINLKDLTEKSCEKYILSIGSGSNGSYAALLFEY